MTAAAIDWSSAAIEAIVPAHRGRTVGRVAVTVAIDAAPTRLDQPALYEHLEAPAGASWDGVLALLGEHLAALGAPGAPRWADTPDLWVEECGCVWLHRPIRLTDPPPAA